METNKEIAVRVVYDRTKKANRSTQGLIQVELRVGKTKKYFTTGIKCFPSQWVRYVCKVRGTADDGFCNDKIKNTIDAVWGAYERIKSSGNEITAEKIKDEYGAPKVPKSKSFIDYAIEKLRETSGIAEKTRVARSGAINKLREFGGIVRFSDLTRDNIDGFDRFLHAAGLKQTSVHMYHAIVNLYIRCAMREGLVNSSPYEWIKIPRGRPELRKYLTKGEFNRFKDYTPRNRRETVARDLFLLQCYTGLSYSDLVRTDFSKLEKHGERYVLRDRRKKTHVDYYVVMLPAAYGILDRYGFILPHIFLQNYSTSLKTIAKRVGIPYLSSHMGRHTFAVMCLQAGVPIESLARMLGHTDIKTTQIYAKVLDSSVEDGFDKLEKVLGNM